MTQQYNLVDSLGGQSLDLVSHRLSFVRQSRPGIGLTARECFIANVDPNNGHLVLAAIVVANRVGSNVSTLLEQLQGRLVAGHEIGRQDASVLTG